MVIPTVAVRMRTRAKKWEGDNESEGQMNRWPPILESLTEEPAKRGWKKVEERREEIDGISCHGSKAKVVFQGGGNQLLNAAEILRRM